MNNEKITLVHHRQQLFQVSFCYIDGDHQYLEKYYFRSTKELLGKKIRSVLREFTNQEDEKPEIIWTFDCQEATKECFGVSGLTRYLEVSAREIDSLDDLDIETI